MMTLSFVVFVASVSQKNLIHKINLSDRNHLIIITKKEYVLLIIKLPMMLNYTVLTLSSRKKKQ